MIQIDFIIVYLNVSFGIEQTRILFRRKLLQSSLSTCTYNNIIRVDVFKKKLGVHRTLRKHVFSNTLKSLPLNNENFRIKKPDVFNVSAENIDCGYSLEPPR